MRERRQTRRRVFQPTNVELLALPTVKMSIKENGGLTRAASTHVHIGLLDSTGHRDEAEAKKSSGWKPTGSLQPSGPLHGI